MPSNHKDKLREIMLGFSLESSQQEMVQKFICEMSDKNARELVQRCRQEKRYIDKFFEIWKTLNKQGGKDVG